MSNKKETKTKVTNHRLDICTKTLDQISNLKCAIIHNNLEDYVNIMEDPNGLWYSSSSMLDCLHAIEEAIFSNNLFSTVCNIYTLECMVNTAMDSIDKEK